jgi:hypothetical protein
MEGICFTTNHEYIYHLQYRHQGLYFTICIWLWFVWYIYKIKGPHVTKSSIEIIIYIYIIMCYLSNSLYIGSSHQRWKRLIGILNDLYLRSDESHFNPWTRFLLSLHLVFYFSIGNYVFLSETGGESPTGYILNKRGSWVQYRTVNQETKKER